MKQRNYLLYSMLIALFVTFGMLLLTLIPASFYEKYGLRPVDILSDIRPNDNSLSDLLGNDSIPKAYADTASYAEIKCPEGIIPFDNYSPNGNNIDYFFNALCKLPSLNRPVRIAFYGDSFIEGDILCGDFRRCMQDTFGGKGVGFMAPASEVAGFRTTINHSYKNWTTYSIINPPPKNTVTLGLNGCCYKANEGAWVKYSGIKNNKHLSQFDKVKVLYQNTGGNVQVSYKLDSLESQMLTLQTSSGVGYAEIDKPFSSVSFSFPSASNLCMYGFSLEGNSGVLVDNFSMRGHSGTGLSRIPENLLSQFDSLLYYDLIILQYGLNVMSADQLKYTQYEKNMIKTVQHLQQAFPKTSILLVGIADRSMQKQGEYVTMPGVYGMVASQKRICAETGISFWNLFEAMGGENSMAAFVNSKPPKANKDYTHLNFNGGKEVGELLFKTLMYEKLKYENRKSHL